MAPDTAPVLAFVEQFGVPVFPCKPNAKIPLTPHGFKDATRDPAQIQEWAERNPACNWGMPTGALSGFAVLDIDIRPDQGKDGDAVLHRLEDEHGALPDTAQVLTPSGGRHYWFRTNGSAITSGTDKLGAGLDVKADGGYVLIPPSAINGRLYTFEASSDPADVGFAEMPAWLVTLLTVKREPPKADHEESSHRSADRLGSIARGEALHDSLRDLAARYVSHGLDFAEICTVLENAMHASKAPKDARWNERVGGIPKLVNSAIEKFRSPAKQATVGIIVKRAPLDWAALAERNPPLRQWAVFGWLGFFINLLVGSGGIGKTLLAQQMGSALALGRTFIDTIDRPLTVLMWACEDDHDELWRRQVQIASFFGAGIEAFRERFIIMPRHGMENALMSTEFGRPMLTPLLNELSEQAADYRADVVILDNVAQLFGGNENDQHHVTLFLNALAGALPGKAVLVLAHPARAAGSEFGGSRAWENVARNRLYLGSHLPDRQPDPDEQPDDNVRILARRKANYSNKDWRRFQYQSGVLVPDAIEVAAPGGIVGHLYDQAAERAVLDGLKRLQEMGMHPSEGATTSRYLPRLLLEYKLAEGRSKAELAGAMRRLMVDGRLVKAVVGKYAGNRSPMYGLTAAE